MFFRGRTFASIFRASQYRPSFPTQSRQLAWMASSAAAGSSNVSWGWIPHVAPPVAAGLLASVLAANTDENEIEPECPWTVIPIPGKHMGCLANRTIKKGELLITERPLCVWPQGLEASEAQKYFDQMAPQQKDTFMALSPGELEDELGPILSRRATNGFSLDLGQHETAHTAPNAEGEPALSEAGFVFPNLARINHSCLPNAAQTMNFTNLRMEIYAVQDIAQGEEICIEYIPGLLQQPHEERWTTLKKAFGFPQCMCALCSTLNPDQLQESDNRRMNMAQLTHQLNESKEIQDVPTRRQIQLQLMSEMAHLVKQEGYYGPVDLGDPSLSRAFAIYTTLANKTKDS